MGRKPKVHGRLYEGPRGKPVRLVRSKVKYEHLFKPSPRGKTGKTLLFANVLKELAPRVYALIVDQFNRPERSRLREVRNVVDEYRRDSGVRRVRPSAREVAAFVIERAMDGAWVVWALKPPYTAGEADSFWRRYVLGHRGALEGVDVLTIKELGGWKTLSVVQRYAHLSPSHRNHAIERLVTRKVETQSPVSESGVAL